MPAASVRRVLTIVESPFSKMERIGMEYLWAACLDSIRRGEAPFASHGFYTRFLNDTIPEERSIGIACGLAWGKKAKRIAFYIDLGWSPGMVLGKDYYTTHFPNIPIDIRKLPTEVYDRLLADS